MTPPAEQDSGACESGGLRPGWGDSAPSPPAQKTTGVVLMRQPGCRAVARGPDSATVSFPHVPEALSPAGCAGLGAAVREGTLSSGVAADDTARVPLRVCKRAASRRTCDLSHPCRLALT